MIAPERMEFFKNEIRKEVSEKVREEVREEVTTFMMKRLQISLIAKFKIVPDFLKETLSTVHDYTTLYEIINSLENFNDAETLNTYIQAKISNAL